MSLKSFIKGWIGETVGVVAQKLLLDPEIYVSLNNITLQTSNGTTQIDHIIVSKFAIFVIEAKPKGQIWMVTGAAGFFLLVLLGIHAPC